MPTIETLLIDPAARQLLTKTVRVHDKPTFRDFYELLDCRIIQVVDLAPNVWLLLDEEGLLNGDPAHFFTIAGFSQPFAGRACIVGHLDGPDRWASFLMHPATAAGAIKFPSADQVAKFRDAGGFDGRIDHFDEHGIVDSVPLPVRPAIAGELPDEPTS